MHVYLKSKEPKIDEEAINQFYCVLIKPYVLSLAVKDDELYRQKPLKDLPQEHQVVLFPVFSNIASNEC